MSVPTLKKKVILCSLATINFSISSEEGWDFMSPSIHWKKLIAPSCIGLATEGSLYKSSTGLLLSMIYQCHSITRQQIHHWLRRLSSWGNVRNGAHLSAESAFLRGLSSCESILHRAWTSVSVVCWCRCFVLCPALTHSVSHCEVTRYCFSYCHILDQGFYQLLFACGIKLEHHVYISVPFRDWGYLPSHD